MQGPRVMPTLCTLLSCCQPARLQYMTLPRWTQSCHVVPVSQTRYAARVLDGVTCHASVCLGVELLAVC